MLELNRPYWVVIHRPCNRPLLVTPERHLDCLAVFSTPDKAAVFMAARGETDFEFRTVTEDTAWFFASNLRWLGLRFRWACVDPSTDQEPVSLRPVFCPTDVYSYRHPVLEMSRRVLAN